MTFFFFFMCVAFVVDDVEFPFVPVVTSGLGGAAFRFLVDCCSLLVASVGL